MPLLLLAAVEIAARREPTRYVASILAIIAAASFALDLSVVGAIFNMTPSTDDPRGVGRVRAGRRLRLRPPAAAGRRPGGGDGLRRRRRSAAATGVDWIGVAGPARAAAAPRPAARSRCPSGAGATTPEGFAAHVAPGGNRRALLLPLVFLSTWPEVFSYRLLPLGACCTASTTRPGFVLPVGAIWWGIRRRWTGRGEPRGRVPGAVHLRQVLRLVVGGPARATCSSCCSAGWRSRRCWCSRGCGAG